MNRRKFLKSVGLGAAALGAITAGKSIYAALESPDAPSTATLESEKPQQIALPKRPLGKMGFEASILGYGAGHLGSIERKEAAALLNEMLDYGINYFDNASSYANGKSEEYMGDVMKTRRKDCFLATKILKRTKADSSKEFGESLQRLQTDHVDLLQLHMINSKEDMEQVFAKDGALQTALEAQKAGKTRFVGITGHTHPEIIIESLGRHQFDSVLMPLGIADTMLNSFSDAVIPVAQKQGIAIIGMKLFAVGRYLGSLTPNECFRYTMNLPISVGIVGVTDRKQFREDYMAMADLKPFSQQEFAALQEKAKKYANTEMLWWKA